MTVAELHRFRAPAVNDSDEPLDHLVKAGLVAERNDDFEIGYVVGHPLIKTIYRGLSAAPRPSTSESRGLVKSGQLGEAARYGRYARRGDTEAIAVLLRVLTETWSRHTFAEAFVILGSLVTLLPPADERWVDVLDALPENVEWASS